MGKENLSDEEKDSLNLLHCIHSELPAHSLGHLSRYCDSTGGFIWPG
jgi:hypothetical protein